MLPPTTTDKVEETEHHGGRPLDGSRDVALREAALELLAEIGYDRLTIDAVAARAMPARRRSTGGGPERPSLSSTP